MSPVKGVNVGVASVLFVEPIVVVLHNLFSEKKYGWEQDDE